MANILRFPVHSPKLPLFSPISPLEKKTPFHTQKKCGDPSPHNSSSRRQRQTTLQLTTLPPSLFSVIQNVAEIEPHQPVPKVGELSHAAAVVLRLLSTSEIKGTRWKTEGQMGH